MSTTVLTTTKDTHLMMSTLSKYDFVERFTNVNHRQQSMQCLNTSQTLESTKKKPFLDYLLRNMLVSLCF